jgi:hypothetical protein
MKTSKILLLLAIAFSEFSLASFILCGIYGAMLDRKLSDYENEAGYMKKRWKIPIFFCVISSKSTTFFNTRQKKNTTKNKM